MCFHAFGQWFRLILDTTLQKPEKMLRRVLTIVRAGVAKIPYFELCAMYQNKNYTLNMLHYRTTQKQITVYD